MGTGWIKLHRKLAEKGFYKNSQYVHLWVHLLLMANHKPHEYMHGGKILFVKEGQLITGRKALSRATDIPESTIEDILRLLENEQQIRQQKTNKYRIITIVNWKEYQESDNTPTSGRHLADTYKNDKKEKNTGEADASQDEITYEDEMPEKRAASKPKYPHSKEVFSWFPKPEASWKLNTTELKHAELLWERGEVAVKKALKYHEAHKDDEGYGYVVVKPSHLEGKWNDIAAYARRQ